MRIIVPFPSASARAEQDAWLAELEAALSDEARGAGAQQWRELRTDVRALAPPMAGEFAARLERRIAERAEQSAPRGESSRPPQRAADSSSSGSSSPAGRPARSGGFLARPPAWLSRLRVRRAGTIGALAILACVALAAVIVASSSRSGSQGAVAGTAASPPALASGTAAPRTLAPSVTRSAKAAAGASPEEAGVTSGASRASASPSGRRQQRQASLSLATTPGGVQGVSDSVARLTAQDEGFVVSSNVQVQEAGASEATLMLRLPSRRLNAALASLGRLASVRAESQSLQDITGEYESARQRVQDLTAERQALLRALATASGQGQLDGIRERLTQSQRSLAQATAALQALSQRSSNSEVEVSVIGNSHVQSEGLTLHRGLHDAGRVLVVALVVLLVAGAVLLPLTIVLIGLAAVAREWRRRQRERVLDLL
jgi:hypothetical protein